MNNFSPAYFTALHATYPYGCLLVTLFYTIIHIVPFSFLRFYLFRHYLRFSISKTILLAAIPFLLECFCQYQYTHIFSNKIAFIFHIIYFICFTFLIKIPVFKQLSITLLIGPLCFFIHNIAYNIEYYFPIFDLPFLEAGLVIIAIFPIVFYIGIFYSHKYLEAILADDSNDLLWQYSFSLIMILTILSILATPFNETRSLYGMLIRLAALAGDFLCMCLIIYASRMYLNERHLQALIRLSEEMRSLEKEHFANINDIEKRTKKAQQELLLQTDKILALLQEKDYPALTEYMSSFLNSPLLKNQRVCNNELINAIMNYWQGKLQPLSVKTDIRIVIGAKDPIDPLHMTSILGNLLKNACEALSLVPEGQPRLLSLHLVLLQGILLITMDNTFRGEIQKDAVGHYLSAKRNFSSRGIGLESILYSISQYEGKFETKTEGNIFAASIWLKLPEQKR